MFARDFIEDYARGSRAWDVPASNVDLGDGLAPAFADSRPSASANATTCIYLEDALAHGSSVGVFAKSGDTASRGAMPE